MYNCRIYHENPRVDILNINVPTLKQLAKELDMTYQQVADLNTRKHTKKYLQFKFSPKIEITKL